MVGEIRIYLEGGGDGKHTKGPLRQGMHTFLKEPYAEARCKKVGLQLIACGSRNNAFEDFCRALESHPKAFNMLLVDSEGPVDSTPCEHLRTRDRWHMNGLENAQCHLMVQMMEAWLVADIDTLQREYGQGFNANALPKNPDVEKIDKASLERGLKDATRRTKKGEYHKTKHAPCLLGKIDADKVRRAAPHCDRLFKTLFQQIEQPQ